MEYHNFFKNFIFSLVILVLSLNYVNALTASISEITFDQNYRESRNMTIRFINEDDDPISDLKWNIGRISPDFEPTIYNKFDNMDGESEKSIIFSLKMSPFAYSGKKEIGYIELYNSDVSFKVYVNTDMESMLEIDNVKVESFHDSKTASSGTIIDSIPNDQINITLDIENIFSDNDDEIRNIYTKLYVEDMFSSDEIITLDDFNLDGKEDKKLEFTFSVPEYIEDGKYKVIISATGKTTDKGYHSDEEYFYLNIERNEYEFIYKANLYPEELSCDKEARLYISISNLGSEKANDMKLIVKNLDLKINLEETFDLSKDLYSSDNKYTKELTLNLDNKGFGTYKILTELYRDNNLLETKNLELKYTECNIPSIIEKETIEYIIRNETKSSINNNTSIQKDKEEIKLNPVVVVLGLNIFAVLILLLIVSAIIKRK